MESVTQLCNETSEVNHDVNRNTTPMTIDGMSATKMSGLLIL